MEPGATISLIGEQIRARRRSLRLTQDELADLASCSPRLVRSLESGKPTVRVDKLISVLDALGLDLVTQRRTP